MTVGVNKAGEDHLSGTVDFDDSLAIPRNPGIAQSLPGFIDESNFSIQAENCAIVKDAELRQIRAATGASVAAWRTQRQELANVKQKKSGCRR